MRLDVIFHLLSHRKPHFEPNGPVDCYLSHDSNKWCKRSYTTITRQLESQSNIHEDISFPLSTTCGYTQRVSRVDRLVGELDVCRCTRIFNLEWRQRRLTFHETRLIGEIHQLFPMAADYDNSVIRCICWMLIAHENIIRDEHRAIKCRPIWGVATSIIEIFQLIINIERSLCKMRSEARGCGGPDEKKCLTLSSISFRLKGGHCRSRFK